MSELKRSTEAVVEVNELPLGNPETFLGEIEEMDLSELKSKTFFVSISTGKRESAIFLSHSLRGPYNFSAMVREVSNIWKEELLHAHVLIPQPDRGEQNQFLDECTIDFIEAKADDIIMAAWLDEDEEESQNSAEYTCKAGIITDNLNDIGVTNEEADK